MQKRVEETLKEIKIAPEPEEADDGEEKEEEISEEENELNFMDGNEKKDLFSKQWIYVSREVPLNSLQFVLKAFGAKYLGWDSSVAGGSVIEENDDRITLQIVDRPQQQRRFLARNYVQPQWVYDSVNARRLLSYEDYEVGAKLPPHSSPFVKTEEMVVTLERQEEEEEEDEDDEEEVREKRKHSEIQQEKEDQKEMAKSMMSKKAHNLYTKLQQEKDKKQQEALALQRKRKKLQKK